MDLTFLLCFILASPVFGEEYYSENTNSLVELDRARSAWNFGSHPLRSRQFIRPKNVTSPDAVIANWRMGVDRMGDQMRTNAWILPSNAASRRQYSHSPYIGSSQSNSEQKPNKPKLQKPYNKFLKSNNNYPPMPPMGYQQYPRPSMLPRPPFNSENSGYTGSGGKKSKSGLPKTMSNMRNGNRGSQKTRSSTDSSKTKSK